MLILQVRKLKFKGITELSLVCGEIGLLLQEGVGISKPGSSSHWKPKFHSAVIVIPRIGS